MLLVVKRGPISPPGHAVTQVRAGGTYEESPFRRRGRSGCGRITVGVPRRRAKKAAAAGRGLVRPDEVSGLTGSRSLSSPPIGRVTTIGRGVMTTTYALKTTETIRQVSTLSAVVGRVAK